ncbi:MAG: hypothetical protein AB1689_14120 [Thermodesulfobacteriota bacterium]
MKLSYTMIGCVLLCGLLAGATRAEAAPVQWKVEDGGNGHFYNVVSVTRGISWPEADAAAIARGSGWYLATITSAEENAFVYGLVAGKPQFWACCEEGNAIGPWIGALRAGGGGGYGWVTGEPFAYANWAAGQPAGIGDRIVLFAAGAPDAPTWANIGGAREDVVSYVIETEAEERIVAVLEEPSCIGSSGISNIRGFAFSSINGVTIDRVVEVTFDRDTPQESETEVACCSSRGDVRAVNPVAPQRSGFSGIFNWCLLAPGKHTISLLFESSTGRTLTVTREFVSRCAHPDDEFLLAGKFDWQGEADACTAAAGGTLVCRTRSDVCDGELRYAWSQAAQGLVLASDCVADASNPPPPPACSDAVIEEVGTEE